MIQMKMFVFENSEIEADLINGKGRTVAYKHVAVNAIDEDHARNIAGKSILGYNLVNVFQLNSDWKVTHSVKG